MRVFAFGSNGSGQLGIGHTEDVSIPTECLFTSPTPNDKVVNIVAGGNHTLILTDSGAVYAAGCNTDGRCGPGIQALQEENGTKNGQAEENILRFRRIFLSDTSTLKTIDTFKCVSATWEGSILVPSTQDKVFVLGSTAKGELGLGKDITTPILDPGVSIPNFPPRGTTVASLASGMGHTVAILSNGEVYGWGGSRKGQLGDTLKAEKIVWEPAKVDGIPFSATGAVCGREFTVVLGQRSQGEFVVLGDEGNRWGIAKIPHSLRSTSGDAARSGYLDIGSSWHGIYVHAASKSENGLYSQSTPGSEPAAFPGHLIAWGRNDRGQLPPPNLPSLIKMGVGSEHVLALLEDGSVATFGWGEHGNCGPDTDSRGNVAGAYNFVSLPDDGGGGKVVDVAAGCATSWLVVE